MAIEQTVRDDQTGEVIKGPHMTIILRFYDEVGGQYEWVNGRDPLAFKDGQTAGKYLDSAFQDFKEGLSTGISINL